MKTKPFLKMKRKGLFVMPVFGLYFLLLGSFFCAVQHNSHYVVNESISFFGDGKRWRGGGSGRAFGLSTWKPKQPRDGKKGGKTNMKMQNAEMEFVAFDAQDVIATSGGLTSYYGYSTTMMLTQIAPSVFSNNTDIAFTSDYAALGKGFESDAKYNLFTTSDLSRGTAYAVTGIKPSGSGFVFVYTKESDFLAKNPGANGNNLYRKNETSVTDVLDWLVANQNLIVQ